LKNTFTFVLVSIPVKTPDSEGVKQFTLSLCSRRSNPRTAHVVGLGQLLFSLSHHRAVTC